MNILLKYVILLWVKIYLYIRDKIIMILPKYIYMNVYTHTICDDNMIKLDYLVYKYLYKYNGKYYKVKTIEDDKYNFSDAINIYTPYNMRLINHCCIISNDDTYLMDITDDIRCFMYYKGVIEWKYILEHLNIENDNKIMIYMNDLDMTVKVYNICDIYNEKFNF